MSSLAMAKIFSPSFKLAILRAFAGINTCPLEETWLLMLRPCFYHPDSKNLLTHSYVGNQCTCHNGCLKLTDFFDMIDLLSLKTIKVICSYINRSIR